MTFAVVGCSHHNAPLAVRERLAFDSRQTQAALAALRQAFPAVEAVVLSTCNRVELYLAAENGAVPGRSEVAEFLGTFHRVAGAEILPHLYEYRDADAVRHLFSVAASLDSMVVGEPQILSQVKQAYETAVAQEAAGPLTHAAFQAALKAAHRVANETAIHQRRVSIPSVAVADFAVHIFERFDDKNILLIGAGEMAEETLQYLRDLGARHITVVNRHFDRAAELAERWCGRAVGWEHFRETLAAADLVISTTGAPEAILTLEEFLAIEPLRCDRPLFVLDLAVPRDFDPAIGQRPGVYLYSIDDLQQACESNRRLRDKELPAARRIVDQETERFVGQLHHRVITPLIRQLRDGWERPKQEELRRLFQKLPDLDAQAREEIQQAFDRLVNKLLHTPMASLRDESRHGIPSALIEALAKLFQLQD